MTLAGIPGLPAAIAIFWWMRQAQAVWPSKSVKELCLQETGLPATNDPKLNLNTYTSQKYSVYTKYLPLMPKFWSVSLYDERFSKTKVTKNQKCTEWPKLNFNT